MFNLLSSAVLCQALADVLRAAAADAKSEEVADGFDRAQLLAASSVARLMALELEHGREVEEWLDRSMQEVLDAAKSQVLGPSAQQAVAGLQAELAAGWSKQTEQAVVALLGALSSGETPAATALLTRLRSALREGMDREVGMFAHGAPPR
jgi:hypothetical protein